MTVYEDIKKLRAELDRFLSIYEGPLREALPHGEHHILNGHIRALLDQAYELGRKCQTNER